MNSLGFIPAAYASGERHRQGGITTTGNTHAHRALIAGAWASRSPAKVSRHLQWRLEKCPQPLQEIRWQAPVRLCQRDRKLSARGTHANLVVVADARALMAFLWAIAQEVPMTAEPPHTSRLRERCRLVPASRGTPVLNRLLAETPPRCGATLGGVKRSEPSSLERGRPPTHASQVGPNPRRSTGSPVVASWLRLFRWPRTPRGHPDEENRERILTTLLTSEVISTLCFRCGEQPQRRRSVGCSPPLASGG
jgi:hypothetical protein